MMTPKTKTKETNTERLKRYGVSPLVIYLPATLARQVKQHAKYADLSVSQLGRRVFRQYLAQHKEAS